MHNEQRAIKLAANLARSFTEREAPHAEEEDMAELANRLERIGRLTGIAPLTVAELGWHVGWALRCSRIDFERLEQELTSAEKLATARRRVHR